MPFQNNYANLVSQTSEAHTRLIRDYDGPNPDFDYIVIGSGIGGGTLADDLADGNPGKRILVVDAGSFVYPTHVYNISRISNGAVAEHFGVDNFFQTETPSASSAASRSSCSAAVPSSGLASSRSRRTGNWTSSPTRSGQT
jgi:hypothetical protein